MSNFVNLGAERCIRATDIIGICAAKKIDTTLLYEQAAVYNLCNKAPAKCVIFCEGNVVFLTNFSYKVVKARIEAALTSNT